MVSSIDELTERGLQVIAGYLLGNGALRPQRLPLRQHAPKQRLQSADGRTTSVGTEAVRITPSATLPKAQRVAPDLPEVDITIKELGRSSASRTISALG